jgi:chemotaxis protein MotB
MGLGLLTAVALGGCASDDWQSKYEEQQRLNLDLSSQNQDLKEQRAQTAAQAEQLAQQARQADQDALRVRKEKEDAEKRAASLSAELAKAQTGPAGEPVARAFDEKAVQQLVDALKRDYPKGIVAITKDGNVEITLPSDVTFASGSADLTDSGKRSLRSLSTALKAQFAPYQVRVEGHTDSSPLVHVKNKYNDNFGLGSARALAVVRFLETDMGIDPKRLMSASRGEHEPVADNKTDGGKKQNRRVEIVVVIPHEAAVSLAK